MQTSSEPDFYPPSALPPAWTLTPAQAAFIDSAEPVLKLVGGRGSGKTYAGAAKAIRYALGNPGSYGLAAAGTYAELQACLVPTFFRLLDPQQVAHWDAMLGACLLKNQALIRFDSGPDLWSMHAGHNFAWVWLDDAELLANDEIVKLRTRLRQGGYPHQMWLTAFDMPVYRLDG